MSKSDSNKILSYLKDQNRPYSATDIYNNLHKEIGKTAVGKALDQLVSDGKIKEKTYGKQKIYFIDQNEFAQSDNVNLKQMDAEINTLTFTLTEIQQKIKSLESNLGALDKTMTTAEAETQLKALKNEIPALESKLKTLETNSAGIGPKEKEAIYNGRMKYCKEWQKRKRIANDVMDAILEGYPKTKKQFFEEVGIETDGDLKVFAT